MRHSDSMHGLLLIDKPAGPTSHEVVARIRRSTGWRRVGHTGTLDPLATGLLPLVVGRATRLAQFLTASDKVYEAVVRIGWATDTYDAQGAPVETEPAKAGVVASPAIGLEPALDRFRGSYLQAPPPFSAKKIGGVRAYALARVGTPAAPLRVPVTVHALEVLSHDSDRLRLKIACSAGFYVRSLAHELGLALGPGAHLAALRRTRSGVFDVAAAVGLEQAEAEGPDVASRLIPVEQLLVSWPAVVVTDEGARRVRHGNDLRAGDVREWPDTAGAPHVRVFDADGMLLAIADPRAPGLLHPGIVVG